MLQATLQYNSYSVSTKDKSTIPTFVKIGNSLFQLIGIPDKYGSTRSKRNYRLFFKFGCFDTNTEGNSIYRMCSSESHSMKITHPVNLRMQSLYGSCHCLWVCFCLSCGGVGTRP
jgi:hypothetical protein